MYCSVSPTFIGQFFFFFCIEPLCLLLSWRGQCWVNPLVLGLLGVSLLLLLGIDAKVNAGYVWNWVRSK